MSAASHASCAASSPSFSDVYGSFGDTRVAVAVAIGGSRSKRRYSVVVLDNDNRVLAVKPPAHVLRGA